MKKVRYSLSLNYSPTKNFFFFLPPVLTRSSELLPGGTPPSGLQVHGVAGQDFYGSGSEKGFRRFKDKSHPHRLSNEESLWSSLLSSDFPQFHNHPTPPPPPLHFSSSSSSNNPPSPNSSSKSLYKIRFERDRARKLAAHRRAVLRIESQIAEHSRKLQEIQLRAAEETEKMKTAVTELSNLRKARQASVALNVWQPEVIRGRHKQIVEQCAVPADSRIHALEMEVRLCKQQITGLDKAYRDESIRLDAAKEQLGSIKYHPLRDFTSTSGRVDECGIKRKKLRKDNIKWAATQVQEDRKQ